MPGFRLSRLRFVGIIQSTEGRTRVVAAIIGVVLAVASGWLALTRLGGSVVTLSYDLPFIVNKAGTPDNIAIVYVDEIDGDSVDRKSQAKLLDMLGENGASAVLYDLDFQNPWKDPAVDEEFAASLRKFRGVDADNKPLDGNKQRPVFFAFVRESIKKTGIMGEQLHPPTEVISEAGDPTGGNKGIVAFIHDKSYTVRELTTGTVDEPSMTWQAAVALGAKLDENTRLVPRWLNYAGPPPDPDITDLRDPRGIPAIATFFWKDLKDGLAPGLFRNKIVIIGGAPGIVGAAAGQDLFSTPFHRLHHRSNLPLMSGVEIQANSLANLLKGNWLTRTPATLENIFIIGAGIVAGFVLSLFRPVKAVAIAIITIVILIAYGVWKQHYVGVWFPWSVPAFVQIPVALVWAIGSNAYIERFLKLRLSEEQARLKVAFSRLVSPKVLNLLEKRGYDVKPGGERIMAAIIFTDIEGFTEMSEKVKNPEQIVATLNDYFRRTTSHIFDHNGTIIKFIGDAIVAVWGAPVPDPAAAKNSVDAAWKLHESDKLVVDGHELRTRVGIHFGDVVAGYIGTELHSDYTVIGDAVNSAARLEGLNKMFGTSILLTEEVKQHMGSEYRTRRVGKFRMKGRSEITIVHELLGPARQEAEPDWIVAHHEALAALEMNDRPAAQKLFEEANTRRGRKGDPVAAYFLAHLADGQPTADGVIDLLSK
jgi:adenylate cyclase